MESVEDRRLIPRLGQGGVDATTRKCCEASFDGADGAVCSTSDNRSLEQTAPSAPLRKGTIFLMAQPPRLNQGGESNACPLHFSFIHSPYDRPQYVKIVRGHRPRLQCGMTAHNFEDSPRIKFPVTELRTVS